MTHPQQTTREVIEQLVEALDHCMDAITERGLNGSPDQAEKWGLQLPLAKAKSAITAAKEHLAHPTPSTTVGAEGPQFENNTFSNEPISLGFTVYATPPQVEPAPSTAGEQRWTDRAKVLLEAFSEEAQERAEVIELLKQGAAISRDRGINLDFAAIADRAAALLQSTADHIAQNRKLVAALQVGELPEPFHPSASHINPDYRDGWNAALAAARSHNEVAAL